MELHILPSAAERDEAVHLQSDALSDGHFVEHHVGVGSAVEASSREELEKLNGVTVVNIDQDHIWLPDNLPDYYEYYKDPLGYVSSEEIEKEMKDAILPPFPVVPDFDLYTELKSLLCPEVRNADIARERTSLSFSEEAVRKVFQTYFTKMVIPPYSSTIVMEEKEERIWILDKTKYLHLYKDRNSYLFMRLFIDKSMFYLFYLDYFSWNSPACSTNTPLQRT